MKVTIRDSKILKTLDFNEVAQHLQKTGWYEKEKFTTTWVRFGDLKIAIQAKNLRFYCL